MRVWLIAAGLAGAFGVGFGAYAAHGFPASSYESEIATKASHYALWHALALLAVDRLAADGKRWAHLSGLLFAAGILLFSGSLALKALTGDLVWPLITPAGGFAFIGGWVALVGVGVGWRRKAIS
ncbi:conserved membrane hypothetical protein [Rhodospirillaceae bacterium LM-1]|nr:conserved membrane hypothetical protein [Rhodospirillaceae bacterium LM-1]